MAVIVLSVFISYQMIIHPLIEMVGEMYQGQQDEETTRSDDQYLNHFVAEVYAVYNFPSKRSTVKNLGTDEFGNEIFPRERPPKFVSRSLIQINSGCPLRQIDILLVHLAT